MKMMERKTYTAFGEMGFGKTGFGETGRHPRKFFGQDFSHWFSF